VNYLLKAVQLLNRDDFKLILVGDGDLKQVYLDLAQAFGIYDKVIFTGYVPDEELIRYYNLCDFFVLPSIDKSEAFGMVLLEAMACGKPVIATNLPGVRQVVDWKVDGRLAKPKDAEHLAEQISYFLDHPKEIEKYGEAGRKKVLEKYSWSTVVQQIISLYNQ
jgi:rhamnosyl/mannosyltransferase